MAIAKEMPTISRLLATALFTLFYSPLLIWELTPNGFSDGNLIAAALIVGFALYVTCEKDFRRRSTWASLCSSGRSYA